MTLFKTKSVEPSKPSDLSPTSPSSLMDAQYVLQAKLVILGDSGVGKSSLLISFIRQSQHRERYDSSDSGVSVTSHKNSTISKSGSNSVSGSPEATRNRPFSGADDGHAIAKSPSVGFEAPPTTVGVSILSVRVPAPQQQMAQFSVWDTAGQERFKALAPMYYRGAECALLVFDVGCERSFQSALTEWLPALKDLTGQSLRNVVLVGNKIDRADADRQVESERARNAAIKLGLSYVEASVFQPATVEAVWHRVAADLANVRANEQYDLKHHVFNESISLSEYERRTGKVNISAKKIKCC